MQLWKVSRRNNGESARSFFHAQNATRARDLNNKKFSMFVDILTTKPVYIPSQPIPSEKVTGCRNPVFSLGNSTVGRG